MLKYKDKTLYIYVSISAVKCPCELISKCFINNCVFTATINNRIFTETFDLRVEGSPALIWKASSLSWTLQHKQQPEDCKQPATEAAKQIRRFYCVFLMLNCDK